MNILGNNKCHKDISIQPEEKQILLNVTEFLNLPAYYKGMQSDVSNRPNGFLNNFYSFNLYATKIQSNLTNIMANHLLKFQLDILTLHEGIKVLLENLLTLRYIPAIFNSHILM